MIRTFNRFELKYIVPSQLRPSLLENVRAQMTPDAEGSESGVYRVTSLYYDTADLQFYRSKLDGLKYRRKVRIRLYGEPQHEGQEVMVEIKQRINRTTQKRRVCLPLPEAYKLCAGRLERELDDAKDRRTAAEVEYLARSLVLSPRCVIAYTRQAFMGGPYEPGLRLTFDYGLCCWDGSRGLFGTAQRHGFLSPDLMVLEVKANEHIPMWVSHMLARHGCALRRYSKYCNGLAHLMSVVPGRFPRPGDTDGRAAS